MNSASAISQVVFVATVIAVAVMFVRAMLTCMPEGRARATWLLLMVATLVITLAVPSVLSRSGALDRYSPLPAPALVLVAICAVFTVILALSPVGARLAAELPLAGLIGFQAFRIAVEWTLHQLFLEGLVPVQMTYAGLNLDVLSGISALIVALIVRAGRLRRAIVLVWNVGALLLLVNIVVIAVLATPTPFRRFVEGPPNLLPSTFPFVWLPTFLVPAALFGHLLVFRALATPRSNPMR